MIKFSEDKTVKLLIYAQDVARAIAHIRPPDGISLRVNVPIGLVRENIGMVRLANKLLQSDPLLLRYKNETKNT